MWYQGASIMLVFVSLLLTACGGKTLDFSNGGKAAPYVTSPLARRVSKMDLLFMIDNSPAMADKQVTLGEGIPDFVDHLINPKCIDPVTGITVGESMDGVCAVGELAFEPFRDIHLGIISSSLGSHGAIGVCEDAIDISLGRLNPHNDDRAHLLSRGAAGTMLPTFENKGFLLFNAMVSGAHDSPAAVTAAFQSMVMGVGEQGCRYPASLEAVYRFLVDPEPYDSIRIDTTIGGFGQALLVGTDQALLQQRAGFLRPDSLVSIVMVTGENDCSIVDGGQGFYPLLPPLTDAGKGVLQRGTSTCLTNPNDRCCFNCNVQSPPAGCPPLNTDPECQKGELTVTEDHPFLRCFNQKQRYGVDFLYPVQRYIDGFTKPQVPNRRGEWFANPLFSDINCRNTGCTYRRDKNLVVVAGVVGVPWQDIAVDPNELQLGVKTPQQLREGGVWADIVGEPLNPTGPVPPRDPHMIESIAPRPGLAGPGSAPHTDPIHGHEWDPSQDKTNPNAHLQYACTFPFIFPKNCTEGIDCDCFGPDLADTMNPVCQNAQGNYTTTQVRGKAYPGTRILQVLQGLEDQAIVGSICPLNSFDRHRDDYQFAPVANAIAARLRGPLAQACLSGALPIDPDTQQTLCSVVEVFDDASCDCDAQTEAGRRTAPEALLTDQMRALGTCRCEILQLSGDAQSACRGEPNPASGTSGWCYIDPARVGSAAACESVRACPADQKRRIRFNSPNSRPRAGATPYLRCETPPTAAAPSVCP